MARLLLAFHHCRLGARFNRLKWWLGRDARGGEGLRVDDCKGSGVAAALKVHHFLRGVVDVNNLAGLYANPNAFC
jgi:hypothetical protein